MDLIDRLRDLSSKIPQLEGHLETEEATKNALIMPFINSLGYNVFDPLEVVPELTADVGVKKGEKVDYAIKIRGNPMILIECKKLGANLEREHASQLFRYFTVTEARFGVLTNGVDFRFFTDLEQPNKMDKLPFFEFSLLQITDAVANELKKFSKDAFDLDNILSTANELKYVKGIKRILAEEWVNPSDEFIRIFSSRLYSGRITQSVLEQFGGLTKRALHLFVSDQINKRLKTVLDPSSDVRVKEEETEPASEESLIETTDEEIEGFYIIKSILREAVSPDRVFMRDTQSYCGVLLDDNNRKPICRMYFNSSKKYLGLFDENKQVTRHAIASLDDIYSFADEIRSAPKFYESSSPQGVQSEGEVQE